ncbi:MAG: hypothetical protein ACAH80_11800 [Alphaproteobacteria bacterium]
MSYVPADKIRPLFNSQSARDAFDRINAMGPKWTFIKKDDGRMYIHPSIETKTIGGSVLSSLGGRSDDDPDDLICRLEEVIVNTASHPDTLVVVNAGAENRREYRYNAAEKDFVLYSGTIYSDKPFSIKLKKPKS